MALAMGAELVINDLPRGASLADRILETDTSFLVGVPPNAIDLLAEMQQARPERPRPADAASASPARRCRAKWWPA